MTNIDVLDLTKTISKLELEIGRECSHNNNEIAASEFFKASTINGNSDAEYKLGWMFENGIGVDKDLKTSFKLTENSALKGNKIGQYNLAIRYEKEKQYGKAYEYYLKSANNGLAIAQNKVGCILN